jgi:hypothetical protein
VDYQEADVNAGLTLRVRVVRQVEDGQNHANPGNSGGVLQKVGEVHLQPHEENHDYYETRVDERQGPIQKVVVQSLLILRLEEGRECPDVLDDS